MLIQRLTIIGVGLIGGSLARALKQAGECEEVIGCGRNLANLNDAITIGAIDRYETDPALAVKDADMVVVAVPLGTMPAIFTAIRKALSPETIVTDVGSVKTSVVNDARQYLGTHFPQFVPGHPIAGTEKSGVMASFPELFQGRRVILTPTADTNPRACQIVTEMWQQTGAEVLTMEMQHHDDILAATSHLPHVLAFSLVDTLVGKNQNTELFRFAAGGFRDFTRIAASDPIVWHDICLANRDAILNGLTQFNAGLQQLENAIRQGDSEAIKAIFSRAKIARDKFSHYSQ